jgi:hypothetical protein
MLELIPFSLVCERCDDGQGIASESEALALGWTGIEEALDLPMANYIGLCPVCRSLEEMSDG